MQINDRTLLVIKDSWIVKVMSYIKSEYKSYERKHRNTYK